MYDFFFALTINIVSFEEQLNLFSWEELGLITEKHTLSYVFLDMVKQELTELQPFFYLRTVL